MSNIMSFIELLNRVTDSNILNNSFINQPVLNKPCSASFVDKLEKVIITNEDVDNNLCCAICQSSFKLGEKVIKLPCKDPHFFHYEADEEECGGILPWFKNNNSCPICREEFPEKEEQNIPVPDENFDQSVENDSDDDIDEDPPILNNGLIIEHIIRRMNRNMNRNIEVIPTPIEIRPRPLEVNYQFVQIQPPGPLLFNIMNNYNDNSSELFDPDLDEAIRRSLED